MQAQGYSPSIAAYRADLFSMIRSFFADRQVLEVETPVLGKCASTDPFIDLFVSKFETPSNPDGSVPVYLQTSPELHMKRLLSRGFESIFQIARVFRNGECSKTHNPEFTMIEWYRTGFDMYKLIDETLELLVSLLGERKVIYHSYQNAVFNQTGIDPLCTDMDHVYKYCNKNGLSPPLFDTLTDALQFLMALKVEKSFDPSALTIIHNFPAPQAVLAQLDPEDSRTALRFEVYGGGLELANGWKELASREENQKRMDNDNAQRFKLGKNDVGLDSCFLDAMGENFPQCSGVALGFDRVCMIGCGAEKIEDVLAFPWHKD